MNSLAEVHPMAGRPQKTASAKRTRHVMFLMCKTDCNDGIYSYCMTLAAGLKEQGCKVYFVTSAIYEAGADEAEDAPLAAARRLRNGPASG